MRERFVSEAIKPVAGTFDTAQMAAGGPGLPRAFTWHGRTIEVARVLRAWHDTGPCTHGSGERYVRKHWFEIEAASGETMKVYFDRQPQTRRKTVRWWLFSVFEPGPAASS